MSYKQLMKDPLTKAIWIRAMTTELARLAQGMDGITESTTDTVFYPVLPYNYYLRYHIIIMRVIGIRDQIK
jgi:hypothetical protein